MRLEDASKPVLVLHLHHGALGIARSLGRLGVAVYGMGTDRTGAVRSSRYFRRVFAWDFPGTPAERSVEELQRVAAELGGRPLLIPGADDLVLLVSEHAQALGEHYDFAYLEPDLVRAMINKKELYFLARSVDIPTPETAFPESEDEVADFADKASFPVMLKGIDGVRLEARTGKKMVRVDGRDELLAQYRDLEEPGAPNLMLQEFIPGGDDSVWMFNGFFDERSECLMGFTGKKLHQFPPYKGATSLGIVLPNPTVREQTVRFAAGIGYKGILDIGFRYDGRDGVYKLLDPNPRVGSTFRLFVGEDGLDVVRAQYLHVTGRPVPESRQADGRKWLVEDWEIDSVRAYAQDGGITLRSWLRDVHGVRELAWWAWDDPAPFMRKMVEIVSRLWGRARRAISKPSARSIDRPKAASSG